MNLAASFINIFSAVSPHFNFKIADCPPIGFAEPCKICIVVTPPVSVLKIEMSFGFITSCMETSADELCPDSLIDDAAICECSSTIPDVKCLFVPSISIELLVFLRFCPISAISPSENATSVFFKIPSTSLVQTVVFLIIIFCDLGIDLFPKALFG